MNNLLKEISQISIYLKGEADRVNEVALFQPLMRKTHFDEENKTIAQRKWRYTSDLPLYRRLSLKVQKFLFKRLPALIPSERVTIEAKFKTVLGLLLAQEGIRDFFLSHPDQREDFYKAIEEAAASLGYTNFTPPKGDNPLKISRQLTQIEGKKLSLIDDLVELNLQMAALGYNERNEILFRILNRVERPPITSVIEICSLDETLVIPITTQYAKYKILEHDLPTGKVSYTYSENHATSSIRTSQNSPPDAKGAMNQRVVIDNETGSRIGSYCGELTTPFHVLEQLLLILGEKNCETYVLDQVPSEQPVQDVKVMLTSLFSWHEISFLTDEHISIQKWDQKILKCEDKCYRLHLLHYNISFNALNKYPTPGELGAKILDINDEALISLTWEVWQKIGLKSEELEAIANRVGTLREMSDKPFLEKQKTLLEEIDAFRALRKTLISQIEQCPSSVLVDGMKGLLANKKADEKKLKGIDRLIYLNQVLNILGYLHNKNCQNATDRSAGANAADKACYAFQKIRNSSFLPGQEDEEELALFKVLYSMYLVWEEPEINAALSTGFIGEKFHNNFIQKNPETTRYLIRWLKKHPEMYLGVSDYRS